MNHGGLCSVLLIYSLVRFIFWLNQRGTCHPSFNSEISRNLQRVNTMIVVCFIGVNSSHLVGYYEFARWVIRLIRIFACIVFFLRYVFVCTLMHELLEL
jgi:hypothetical protein